MSSRSRDVWQKTWEIRCSGATADTFTKLHRRSYVAQGESLVKFDARRTKLEEVQTFSRYCVSVEFSRFFLKKCLSALNLNKLRVITLSFSNANLRYALSCSLSWVIFSVSLMNNLLVIFSARVDKYNWWVPLSKLVLIRQSNIWILLIHRRFYLHFYINYDNKWWYSTK